MRKTTRLALLLCLAVIAIPRIGHGQAGFVAPPLNPTGVQLETKQLGAGVYALLASRPPVDNNGFVVGERGVLVIDAHINGAMARETQAAVRRVTQKPILYVVNTNYRGDHTFGNYAFPADTLVVAQRRAAERMHDFEHEKAASALPPPPVSGDLTSGSDGSPATPPGLGLRTLPAATAARGGARP